MRNVLEEICRENQSARFMFSNFFRKSCCLWDIVYNYCRIIQATGESIAVHAHCMLGK